LGHARGTRAPDEPVDAQNHQKVNTQVRKQVGPTRPGRADP
jgi:hypothetical protein